MGLLDDAIREHLELKRRRGADPGELERQEREALGPVRRTRNDVLGDSPLHESALDEDYIDEGEEGFADAWPDEPHLDITYKPYTQLSPLNAISRFIMGLSHDDSHVEQLREIMRQAHAVTSH